MNKAQFLHNAVAVILTLFILSCGTVAVQDLRQEAVPPAAILPTTVPPTSITPTAVLPTATPPSLTAARVVEIVNGDTIHVEIDGQVYPVRYIGIDCPASKNPDLSIRAGSIEATTRNTELVLGKTVHLEKDITDKDRYGRLLRYVWIGDQMINQVLVCEGYAYSKSYPPDTKYQSLLDECQRQAQAAHIGLWAITTTATQPAAIVPLPIAPVIENTPVSRVSAADVNCDPSYPDVCIPPPPPDLDCKDIPHRRFRVLPPDSHRFDRDRNGVGCEN